MLVQPVLLIELMGVRRFLWQVTDHCRGPLETAARGFIVSFAACLGDRRFLNRKANTE